jgi:hypothetical protein
MPGKHDIAWIADTIISHVQSNLPAKLDALDIEYDDGIILEDIPSDFMFISEKVNPPGFPIMAVLPEGTNMNPFDGQSRYGIEHSALTIAVALISRGESEEELKRRTMRTVRGISEIFLDDRTMGNAVNDVILLEKEYSAIVGEEGTIFFLQEAQLSVRVETMT